MTTSDPDIVIVGAGAAGIGAARRLSGHGYSTVIIEQLPRTGGRAWTYATNAGPVDLGCGWLHSADRNPWTRIAAELGFVVDRRVTAWGEQFQGARLLQQRSRRSTKRLCALERRHPQKSARVGPGIRCTQPELPWTPYLQALSGYISGDELEHISVTDYVAYDDALH